MLKANPGFDGPVVQVATHDVVIRGLRIRRGPTRKKGCCGDAISISNKKSEPHHVVIDVGGWPVLKGGTPSADKDHDGIPDRWETEHGLNPSDPRDRNGTNLSEIGYTNLEIYINGLLAK